MRKFKFYIMFLLLAVMVLPGRASAQDAAMVVDLIGPPAVYETGEKAGQEVMLMDFLGEGTRLRLGDGTTLVLNYFASGAREEIAGPGVITAGASGSEKGAETTVKSDKVDYIPPLAQAMGADAQHAGAVALRDVVLSSNRVFLVSPTETAVRGAPLTFEWRPVEGAVRYRLVAADILGDVIVKTETEDTTYNFNSEELIPGEEYNWKVQALAKGDVIARGSGKFYVLTKQRLSQVSHTEQYIEKQYRTDSTEAKIALAMLYKKYELNMDARRILEELREKHPQNTNIARQLDDLNGNYRRN